MSAWLQAIGIAASMGLLGVLWLLWLAAETVRNGEDRS